MDYTPPGEWVEFADALLRFVDREVAKLENGHRPLLASDRTVYGGNGRFVPPVLELRRRSAELGFYTALSPESLGRPRSQRCSAA